MRGLLALYLPVLIPSWRFFKDIGPSPRVEVSLTDATWVEATARPDRIGVAAMITRLFWNPAWNETLFFVSLAEQILLDPNSPSGDLIRQRLLRRFGPEMTGFRILLVDRTGTTVEHEARL